MIDKTITIEDLVETISGSVRYLMEQGISPVGNQYGVHSKRLHKKRDSLMKISGNLSVI